MPIAWHSITNIKLAAILYTLGFPLRDGMPCSKKIQEGTYRQQNGWWFETTHQWGEEDLKAADLAYWYKHKAEFEAQHAEHPITWMRQALDGREWLLKVMHGECRPQGIGSIGSARTYATDDLKFGAILVTGKFHLLKYADRRFTFLDDGKIEKRLRAYKLAFDPEAPSAHWPLTWMREALFARDYMARLMQDPRCIPMVKMNYRGRHIILSSQASRETKHDTFSNL